MRDTSKIQKMPRGNGSRSSSQTARATLALREMLVQGRFRPGERIREVPLAAQLNVSRIPLHLALERLAHEGFLQMRPTRGFVVQGFSTEDIYDAIELRGLLEGAAARLATERLKDVRELEPLEEANREIATLVRRRKLTMEAFNRYIELNAKFHSALLDLSRSRMLRRAIEQANTKLGLQPFDRPGQRRLGDAQLGGGGDEAAVFDQRQDRLELTGAEVGKRGGRHQAASIAG